ncbi:disease resistance protein Roq1-like [Macadamia integrifolia]|uniref:disease resistance protein Roq1-like n=1 Tax=Macadamia integrifolia TaxID=60698 RepID=UPI001C4E5A55|nr:disease resistance protein Roq1-like [Macadamia integrifolia]
MESHVGSKRCRYDVGSISYDVFINFRGEDTHNTFVAHSYSALKNRGIHAFIDSKDLWKGEDIGPELLRAIKVSELSIAVLSERYIESKCLRRHLKSCLKRKNKDVAQMLLGGGDGNMTLKTKKIDADVVRDMITTLIVRHELPLGEDYVKKMAQEMKKKFDKYWDSYNIILAIAVVFVPRYKLIFVRVAFDKIYSLDSTAMEKFNLVKSTLE